MTNEEFQKQQLKIVIGNVEFALEPENQTYLDSDDCEIILELLKELYVFRHGEEYTGEED